jgi:hypothetical protein
MRREDASAIRSPQLPRSAPEKNLAWEQYSAALPLDLPKDEVYRQIARVYNDVYVQQCSGATVVDDTNRICAPTSDKLIRDYFVTEAKQRNSEEATRNFDAQQAGQQAAQQAGQQAAQLAAQLASKAPVAAGIGAAGGSGSGRGGGKRKRQETLALPSSAAPGATTTVLSAVVYRPPRPVAGPTSSADAALPSAGAAGPSFIGAAYPLPSPA